MKHRTDPTDQLLGHLTGSLDEQSRTELERRVLEDDELYEQLKSAEGEIVDAYIHGELTEPEEGSIATLLESSDRLKAKAELSVALDTAHLTVAGATGPEAVAKAVSVGEAARQGVRFRPLPLLALLLLLVALVWLAMSNAALDRSLQDAEVQRQGLEQRLDAQSIELEALQDDVRRTSRRLARLEAERRLGQQRTR